LPVLVGPRTATTLRPPAAPTLSETLIESEARLSIACASAAACHGEMFLQQEFRFCPNRLSGQGTSPEQSRSESLTRVMPRFVPHESMCWSRSQQRYVDISLPLPPTFLFPISLAARRQKMSRLRPSPSS